MPDHGDMAATFVSVFVEGTPEARAGALAKFFRGHGHKPWEDDAAWAITAYRCESCGKLDHFAKDRPNPELKRQVP
ncbi:MAG: hypothetical protein AB7P00_41645 [Sandaracinaceae bacterium]